jgi:ADP-L-glycero-D-manno-heptose 6-epimerase
MDIVTGAAGFIGSVLLARLNELGLDPVAVDDVAAPGSWRNLSGKRVSEFIHKRDFLAMLADDGFCRGVRCIVHLGACSSTTEADAAYLIENNYRYSRQLITLAARRGIRVVYASSAAVYGDGGHGFSDDPAMTSRYRPLNPYGLSKQLTDLWCVPVGDAAQACGLRFFNVFGPNEYHKGTMASVAYHAYRSIQTSGGVDLFRSYRAGYGDGEQRRDFVYVKDCVETIVWLMGRPDVKGVYNVGTGVARTWNDLAHAVFVAMGRRPVIRYVEMDEALRQQYQYFTRADVESLIRAGCPVRPRGLEDAVQDYVRNHLETGDPYV